MGNSTEGTSAEPHVFAPSQNIEPAQQQHPAPSPKQQTEHKGEKGVVEYVEDGVIDDQSQKVQKIFHDDSKKIIHRRSADLNSESSKKIKKELPPLKKLSSFGKITDNDKNTEARPSLGANSNFLNIKNAEKEQTLKSAPPTETRLLEVQQIKDEVPNSSNDLNLRQIRVKKLRLSKQQQNIPGAFF